MFAVLALTSCSPSISDIEKRATEVLNRDNAASKIHVTALHLESIGDKEYKGTFSSKEADGDFTYDVLVKYDGDRIVATPTITQDSLKQKIKHSFEADNGPKVTLLDLTKTGDAAYTGTLALAESGGNFTYDITVNAPSGQAITWKTADTKETLTRKVRTSIETNLASSGITVTDLTLIKMGEHEYSGLLQTSQPGGSFKNDVTVEVDDNSFKWKILPSS